MKIKIILSLLFLFFFQFIKAQNNDNFTNYILNGTVVNGETNELLIGAHIVSSTHFGTKTDENGFFSLVVFPNNTIRISYVGYKTLFYITPFQENGNYLIKFNLYTDSISLNEVEIFPYPSYDEFKKAFTELKTKEREIKMEGVKMYQNRNIEPWEFTMLNIFTNPISLMYDKLLDKKAKLKRRLDRKRKIIKDASFIEDNE